MELIGGLPFYNEASSKPTAPDKKRKPEEEHGNWGIGEADWWVGYWTGVPGARGIRWSRVGVGGAGSEVIS